jgi:hypothetical protein
LNRVAVAVAVAVSQKTLSQLLIVFFLKKQKKNRRKFIKDSYLYIFFFQ